MNYQVKTPDKAESPDTAKKTNDRADKMIPFSQKTPIRQKLAINGVN